MACVLPPGEMDKDRDAIRRLPVVLAGVGMRIVRLVAGAATS
ncbi:hypothetical protein [Catellatospora tritici]|nr:hypothetical protein [Catellatospora tritici]